MTEAGKQWAKKKAGGTFVYESQEAEFWIKAFVAEVEKRASEICAENHPEGDGPDCVPCDRHTGEALDILTSELIGDNR